MREKDARRSYLLGTVCLAILAPLFLLAHIRAEERLSQLHAARHAGQCDWARTEGMLVAQPGGQPPLLLTARELPKEVQAFLRNRSLVSRVHRVESVESMPPPPPGSPCEQVEHGVLLKPDAKPDNFFHAFSDYVFLAYAEALRSGWISGRALQEQAATNVTLRLFARQEWGYSDGSVHGAGMLQWLVPRGVESVQGQEWPAGCACFRRMAVANEFVDSDTTATASWNTHFRSPHRMRDTHRAARAFRADMVTHHLGAQEARRLLRRPKQEFLRGACTGKEPVRVGFIQRRKSRFLWGLEAEVAKAVERMPGWRVDFRVLRFEELSAAEAIAAVADLHVLGGIHGAGLAHSAFLRAGATLLEISQEPQCYWRGMYFRSMAHSVGAGHIKHCTPYAQVVTKPWPRHDRLTVQRFADKHMQTGEGMKDHWMLIKDAHSINLRAHEIHQMLEEAVGTMCGGFLQGEEESERGDF